MVDVDADGLVTRWRDYFDLHQIDDQVAAHPPPRRTDAGRAAPGQASASLGTPKYSW